MPANDVRDVLIVDDDLFVRISIADYLEDSGYRVHMADSPHEALELLNNVSCHAVICDYRLPRMSGLDFLLLIKQTKPALPVIFFTGMADSNLADELLAKGAAACLFKPLPNLKVLVETIEQAIVSGSPR